MILFKPQVHLRKKHDEDEYCIHVVTYTDNSQYRATGILSATAVEGGFKIEIEIEQDEELPNMDYITPVVHTSQFEDISLDDDNPFLFIEIVNESVPADKGQTQMHYLEADEEIGGIGGN